MANVIFGLACYIDVEAVVASCVNYTHAYI